MFGPAVEFSLPPASWFRAPGPLPFTVQPPPATDGFSWRSPINIDPELYDQMLSFRIPVTVALGYLTFVTAVNQLNRSRGFKPWSVSKTDAFFLFTLLHNLGLALYSGITCVALVRAISVSVPSPLGPNGLAGTVDALCRIHGPRGFGSAVYFNAEKAVWTVKNEAVRLGGGGLVPDATDVGRIWNEGLAWWGWVFYLSKFYEVVDTFIILAKGKRSSTLQTYHHAGAMICMWAGIRYMSPPIWMFVLVNAGIHTMMYTYYTLSTLGIQVPKGVKGSITTIQILQFLVGASYAAIHLFVSYSVPVATPFYVAGALQAARASIAAAAATVDAQSWFKKLAYRAAGAEGLAERVSSRAGRRFSLSQFTSPARPHSPFSYRNRFDTVRCLDTSGEAFAIWLNVIYLAPLTILFLRFFVKTYSRGSIQKAKASRKPHASPRLDDASKVAAEETSDTVEGFGERVEKSMADVGEEIERGGRDLKIRETFESAKSESSSTAQDILETVQRKVKETAEEFRESDSVEWVSRDVIEVAERLSNEERIQTARQLAEKMTEARTDEAKSAGQNGGVVHVEGGGPHSHGDDGAGARRASAKPSSKRTAKGGVGEGEWMKRKTPVDREVQADFDGRVTVEGGSEEAERRPGTPSRTTEEEFGVESPDGGFGLNG